jgi:hypothetical protein
MKLRLSLVAVVVAVCALGCGAESNDIALPDLTEPLALTDVNPDPNIVEVQLVAGLATTAYLRG